jgi:hypothetical protein
LIPFDLEGGGGAKHCVKIRVDCLGHRFLQVHSIPINHQAMDMIPPAFDVGVGVEKFGGSVALLKTKQSRLLPGQTSLERGESKSFELNPLP